MLALLAATAGVSGVIGCGRAERVVSAREAEQKVRAQARRQRMPVTHVLCARAQHQRDSFDCFAEGPDDQHLAYRVTVQPSGRLIVRPPE
jgi:hypothetical protein